MKNSTRLFEEAVNYIPGGVNSPVRAFKSVGGNPVFIRRAKGAYLYDEDQNKYIDLIGSWGPMLFGHAFNPIENEVRKAVKNSFSFGAPTKKEVDMAKMLCDMVPSLEMVRMVNSGTEATMSAIRLARAYTKKSKIVKFEGCYHGHGDSFLISAGSGAMTLGQPDSWGITEATINDTLSIPYNNAELLEELLKNKSTEIAAIILEPVVGNMGCVLPNPGYLEKVRSLATQYGVVLIFDEVMTGFRLAAGGAQALFGVTPDLCTMGKIIGGGMPVGAYGGKREIMQLVAPSGPMYQAGTLSGNPIAMSAGLEMLRQIKKNPGIYQQLEETGQALVQGIQKNLDSLELNFTMNQIGSMFSIFFTAQKVTDLNSAKTSDLSLFGWYFHEMLKQGIYLAPSQFESLFLSTKIDQKLLNKIIKANYNSLKVITKK
jgi:glutamate-1-semialdehyde 2,1-aminomutase